MKYHFLFTHLHYKVGVELSIRGYPADRQRCKPIQRVADNALRIIANVEKPATMHRIRQEMGVTSINTRGYDLRERAYFKYPTLRTWISDLVKQSIKNQTSTWVTGTARWIKRYCQTVGRGNTV
ncbi:hypothetical protein BB560_002153 [Smittium megazygosporum]|uniref:Uncharacterized protein n=1 Tax=Smittium megazygosporum TaxID=133381 RepID=A0A2T9ZFM3_9FUNG|nr:hypothetical protein BB560_002153 [Smittium megazygosporum]